MVGLVVGKVKDDGRLVAARGFAVGGIVRVAHEPVVKGLAEFGVLRERARKSAVLGESLCAHERVVQGADDVRGVFLEFA